MRFSFLGQRAACVTFLCFAFAGIASAEPPPVEAYAALPLAESARLSPDGTSLAVVAQVNNHAAFLVWHLNGDKPTILPTGDYVPNWFQWKDSKRLVASIRFSDSRYGTGLMAETRLLFINADGTDLKIARIGDDNEPRADVEVIGNVGNVTPQVQDRVVSMLPNDPDHILVEATPVDDWEHPDVLTIDVHSGHATMFMRHRLGVDSWRADPAGAVRLGAAIHHGTFVAQAQESFYFRPAEDADWQSIYVGDLDAGKAFKPVALSATLPDLIYVLSNVDTPHLSLWTFDASAKKFVTRIATDSMGDITVIEDKGELIGYNGPSSGGVHYVDPQREHELALVQNALHEGRVAIFDRSEDGTRSLAYSKPSNNQPDTYWLLDKKGKKATLNPVIQNYADIPDDQIAPSQMVFYRARDGLTIPALLTLPVGYQKHPIAFIVLPHGGPTGRDVKGFDWLSQFLASRGYGILQPQFRGSTGFGPDFQRAGYQQWGGAMQDDVTDGTKWIADQGYADPSRICIAGWSYGGYAALMGPIKEPSLYRCAAAMAPVTDLHRLIRDIRHTLFKDLNIPRISGDGQDLDEISPADQADKLEVPVLLVHGRQDYTVPVEHTEEMARALGRAGHPAEVVYIDDADHYLSHGEDRVTFLKVLEGFLAKNLPVNPAHS